MASSLQWDAVANVIEATAVSTGDRRGASGASRQGVGQRQQQQQLHAASERGELGTVRDLLSAGVSVNARGSRKRTALMVAATAGHLAVCEALLSEGADPGAEDSNGNDALYLCKSAGGRERARLHPRPSHAEPPSRCRASADFRVKTRASPSPFARARAPWRARSP